MLTISQRLSRFFWLSWLWGMGLTILVSVGFILFSLLNNFTQFQNSTWQNELNSVFLIVLMEGAGALAGNWLRQWLMRHVFRRAEAAATPAARLAWLVGGTLLLFVASVLFCQLVFMVFTFNAGIISMLVPLLRLFFILSAPWLLTAPLAACWVCRDWLRPIPVSGTVVSK